MLKFISKQNNQTGQTLIETVVAIFILVMGITAALGLANYSLNATSNIRKQVIAMGLAREGIEAVKNMRDTNWLQAPLSSSCYDFASGTNIAYCYPTWLSQVYGIGTAGLTQTYALNTDTTATATSYWSLAQRNSNFGLNFDAAVTPQHGIYSSFTPTTHANATSDFARMITITAENSTAPFSDANVGPRLVVTSQVWWKDKGCPTSETAPTNGKCIITLKTYLTNWKDY